MGSISTDITGPPATHKAVVINEKYEPVIWDAAPCPALPADQVLVRTEAVGLNPSNTKMTGSFVTPMATMGSDWAGIVVAVGSEVKHVVVGDRVCGAQNEMCGLTPEWGAFGEYNVTRGRAWMKVPTSLSIEAAASLPVGISTAGLAIRLLGLPLPDKPVEKPAFVLVYGGSTATATIAMQLLRLAGLIPIATCSPRNFELAKSNGAEEVFDYHDKDVAQKIVSFTRSPSQQSIESGILITAEIIHQRKPQVRTGLHHECRVNHRVLCSHWPRRR